MRGNRITGAWLAALLALAPQAAAAETILFVGNSFTYAGHSPAWKYRADTVTDINGLGAGGVPALFKRFADQSGLDFTVSHETSGGKSLRWHWETRLPVLGGRWDHVILQDYSTLDRNNPGNDGELIEYSRRLARFFAERNPQGRILLNATWSRPDLVFRPGSRWFGRSILDMGLELHDAYLRAARNRLIAGVIPTGLAYNCAILAGVADPNPYDGIGFGELNLWTYDHYHASAAGAYLQALVVFAKVTGRDPRLLGDSEESARDLGLGKVAAASLQTVAWQTVSGACSGRQPDEPPRAAGA